MTNRTMTKNLNIATSPQMLADLKKAARRMGVSTPQIARLALAMYLERGIDYAKPLNEREVLNSETSPT